MSLTEKKVPKPFDDADPRSATLQERLDIGFEEIRERWKSVEPEFDHDTLTILGHPVMERWEDDYMRTLAMIAGRNKGRVLEIGFGMGISARHLQKEAIDEHWIIEANAGVLEAAKAFTAEAKSPVKLMHGFWEEIVLKLEGAFFDGILFDTYPLSAEEVHKNHFNFFREAHRLLKPSGVLTYYSDEVASFSPDHLDALKDAGFMEITGVVCNVNPPEDCKYWTSKTILAPIVIK